MCTSAVRADGRGLLGYDRLLAAAAIVGRNPVSPPQLAGNAPVTDVLEPVQIDLVKALRYKCQIAVLNRFDRRLCHFFHSNEPLLLDHRLDRRSAAIVCADCMRVRDNFDQKTKFFQVFDHFRSRVIAVHSRVLASELIDRSVVVQDRDLGKAMALSDFKVVRVMSRCDLDAACTELHIDILIGDDRDLSACERQLEHLSDYVFISVIIRVYSDSCIAEQGFRTGRGNFHKPAFLTDYRIINVPEEAVLIDMFDLSVRDRRSADRAPVDDLGAFVNVAFLIKAHEHFKDRVGTAFIHCKSLTLPVG